MNDYYIVISSNRPAEQIVDYMNDLDCGIDFELFEKDLENNMYWNKDNIIGVTNEKAVGILYVDDRGFRYHNLEELREFLEIKDEFNIEEVVSIEEVETEE